MPGTKHKLNKHSDVMSIDKTNPTIPKWIFRI